MYPTNLNTNEVKNSSGVEVEFERFSSQGRQLVFSQVGETPARPHRITISHQEIGSGASARRRSVVRVDKTIQSDDPTLINTKISAYAVLDVPIGLINTLSEPKHVVAELVSMLASRGASTTILFDCTGVGAEALVNGSL